MKSVCIIACLATNGMAAEPMRKFKEATHTKSLHIDINTKGEILAHEPDENEDENEKQVVALEGLAQGAAEKWMASINRYVGFDISRLASQAGNVTAEEQMRRAMTQLMDTSNKSNPWSLLSTSSSCQASDEVKAAICKCGDHEWNNGHDCRRVQSTQDRWSGHNCWWCSFWVVWHCFWHVCNLFGHQPCFSETVSAWVYAQNDQCGASLFEHKAEPLHMSPVSPEEPLHQPIQSSLDESLSGKRSC